MITPKCSLSFPLSLRLEDELRDETNDEANVPKNDKKNKKNKKKMTRAERRKKRREDRERRRKDRADKRAKKREQGGESAISIVFWATMNFFYGCIRPWVWPWWILVPLFLVCIGICGYGAYSVWSETQRSQFRRVPRHNSWSYKAASMFRKKSEKQRV